MEAINTCVKTDPWKNFRKIWNYDFSGIADVISDLDEDAPCEIFNLNGVKVGDSFDTLASGLYIISQGNKRKKIIVE